MLCSRCRFYWRLHPQMPEPDQTLIKSTWPSIPNKVDAAYENPEKDQVLIFSGGCTFHFRCSSLSEFLRLNLCSVFQQGSGCGLWMDTTWWTVTRSTSTNWDFPKQYGRWTLLCTSERPGRRSSSLMKTTGGVFMSLKLWGDFYVVNKSVKNKFLTLLLNFYVSPTALMKQQAPWMQVTHDPLRTTSQGWMTKLMLQLIIMVRL